MSTRGLILLLAAVFSLSASWFALLTLSSPSARELPEALNEPAKPSLLFDELDRFLAEDLGARLLHNSTGPDGYISRRYAIPEALAPRAVGRTAIAAFAAKGLVAERQPPERPNEVSLSVKLLDEPVGALSFVPTLGLTKGLIAVVIDDFGYRLGDMEKGFLNIGAKLAVAVIPGHPYSREVALRADKAGLEVMVHLPMEPEGYADGEEEFILLTSQRDPELRRRIRAALDAIPEASGLNNHMGSKASIDTRVMSVLFEELGRADKYFIDSATSSGAVAAPLARKSAVPYARRAVFLDHPEDYLSIEQRLDELKKVAVREGVAVAIGHPRPRTLALLRREIPRLKEAGFRLVYPSEIVR